MNDLKMKIAIIGLGYVGLPLAVEFGKKMEVVGFDINKPRIAELQSGKDSTLEVNEDDLREATRRLTPISSPQRGSERRESSL